MGSLFEEKGMFVDVEKQYKKVIYWGNSILIMPVKIPSKSITDIKNETKKYC